MAGPPGPDILQIFWEDFFQTRPSQIHRSRSYSHQCQSARAAANLLQEKEIRSSRSPSQGYKSDPKAPVEA